MDLFSCCIESFAIAAIVYFTVSYCRYVWVRVSLNAIDREVAELQRTVAKLQRSVVSCPAVLRTAEPPMQDVIVPFKRPQREVVEPNEWQQAIAQVDILRTMTPAHLRKLCRQYRIACSTRGKISERTIAQLAEAMQNVA